eukprot:s508_g30.t1
MYFPSRTPTLIPDNVKYLTTLEKFIEPLYSGTPAQIIETLPALLNSAWGPWGARRLHQVQCRWLPAAFLSSRKSCSPSSRREAQSQESADESHREGMDERAPFLAVPYDGFRRGIKQALGRRHPQIPGPFCDSTGYGVTIYQLVPDAAEEDLVLRAIGKTSGWNEQPATTFTLCNILEWHYDAAQGSPRKRVCGTATAKMHWYALRQYMGWLYHAGHIENMPQESPTPVHALASVDNLKLFFRHLEQDRVLLPKFLGGKRKAKRATTQKIVAKIRGLGKTVAEKRAVEGQRVQAPEAQLAEPLTAEEMADNHTKWMKRIKALEKKMANLPPHCAGSEPGVYDAQGGQDEGARSGLELHFPDHRACRHLPQACA